MIEVKIGQINQESIIIVEGTFGGFTQLTIGVNRMEFDCENDTFKVTEIGATNLSPTVKTNVGGFKFDASTKEVIVVNTDGSTALTVSTDRLLVRVRVDFNTATITVFQ